MTNIKQEYIKNKSNEIITPITQVESVYSGNTSLLDFFYPVGTYYETSVESFNPNIVWGGTWVQDTEGQVLVSKSTVGTFASVGSNVGSENKNISIANLPSHTHGSKSLVGKFESRKCGTAVPGIDALGTTWSITDSGIVSRTNGTWSGSHSQLAAATSAVSNPITDVFTINATHEHESVGSGTAFSVVQSSKVCIRWHRIA